MEGSGHKVIIGELKFIGNASVGYTNLRVLAGQMPAGVKKWWMTC